MEDMFEEWKKELIEAGKLEPDQEISQNELMTLWAEYNQEKIKGMMIPHAMMHRQDDIVSFLVQFTMGHVGDLEILHNLATFEPEIPEVRNLMLRCVCAGIGGRYRSWNSSGCHSGAQAQEPKAEAQKGIDSIPDVH